MTSIFEQTFVQPNNTFQPRPFFNYQPPFDLQRVVTDLDAAARQNFRDAFGDAPFVTWVLENAAKPYWDAISPMWLPGSTTSQTEREMALQWLLQKSSGSGSGGGSGYNVAQATDQFNAIIQDYQGQMGLEGDYSDLASQAANNHWSPDMLREALAAHIDWSTANRPGIVHDTVDKARAAASDYLVSFNNDELLSFAKEVAANNLNQESILGAIRDRAKQQYAWLANTIDSGITLKQYFQPHREEIAKLLELGSADNVDLTDPKWGEVIHRAATAVDPVDRSMTVAETARYVRKMDEWKMTNNAKSTAAAASVALGKIMGKIA